MNWLWGVAAVLVLWAGIAAMRRSAEHGHRRNYRPPDVRRTSAAAPDRDDTDDEIDREALEEAEREVKDLDALQPPEEGFKGDDWGPGTPRWM